jgi:hypothetical protein
MTRNIPVWPKKPPTIGWIQGDHLFIQAARGNPFFAITIQFNLAQKDPIDAHRVLLIQRNQFLWTEPRSQRCVHVEF